jgi:hypothetical protein
VGHPRLTSAINGRRAHNGGVGDVLIDLGEQHGRLPSESLAPLDRPHGFRAALAALSAALLVGLGGAADAPAPVGPVLVPARLGDTMFVEESRLYVVGSGLDPQGSPVQRKIVSMYGLPGGELLSRTTIAVTGAIFQVTSVAETVLVTYQVDTVGAEATVALRAGTDRAIWRAPARLVSVSAADNLVLLSDNSPYDGDQHWYGIDLATGRTRWSYEQPAQGHTTEAGHIDGFPSRLITATTAGHIEVRDTVTGKLVSEGDVTARPGWSRRGITVWPTGDLVLIGGLGGITAYTLAGLQPRWHSTVELFGRWVQDCVDAICVFGYRGGVQALDPATGRVRWAADRWTGAVEAGPYLLVNGDQGLEGRYPLAVVEPVTGLVHGDFGSWRFAGPARADGTVVGLRQRIGDDVVFYALLDPATLAVRVLGAATAVSGDCQATTDVLVCRRIDAGVAIWPLTHS